MHVGCERRRRRLSSLRRHGRHLQSPWIPTPERLASLNEALGWFGLPEIPLAETIEADAFQTVLNEVAASDDAPILMPLVLRSMQQALYSAIEAPHFGLAYERYAHFTSPIRRLPDLVNHRLIKEVMESTHKTATGNRRPQMAL